MAPDGNSNSARSILLSSSSFFCSSPKNVPSPGGRIKAICGEMAGCRNRKDQTAKLVSLSALARADAGLNPRGAWGWHAALARLPAVPTRTDPSGRRRVPARVSSPKIILLEGATVSRETPRTPPGTEGGRPLPDWLSRCGPRPGWSQIPPLAALRGWGCATLSPQHPGGAGTVLIKPPPLPTTMRLGPDSRQEG